MYRFRATELNLTFPFSALTLLVGQQGGHPACKNVGRWYVGGDNLSGALYVLYLYLSSIILSSNKIQTDILVPAYPGPPAEMAWPIKQTEL